MRLIIPLPEGRSISKDKVREVKQLFKQGYPEFHDYIDGSPVAPEEDRTYIKDCNNYSFLELRGEVLDWYRNLGKAMGCSTAEAISLAVYSENKSAVLGFLCRA